MRFLHMSIFFLTFLQPSLAQKVEGTYVQDDLSNLKLKFLEDLFLFTDDFEYSHLPPYNCSDTIAFGYWKYDNKHPFIKLYTDPLQIASLVEMKVSEEKEMGVDSVYFVINNPLEQDYKRYNEWNESARIVYYTIYIETGDSELDTKTRFLKYYTNEIVIRKPKTGVIKSFEITTSPTECILGWRENMPPKSVTTLRYEVRDQSVNVFNINIPELSSCYLSSLRLNGDYVKVLDRKQLEWDGHIYHKK